jgi:hypothetical protein
MFDADMPRAEREEAFGTLVGAIVPLIQGVSAGEIR